MSLSLTTFRATSAHGLYLGRPINLIGYNSLIWYIVHKAYIVVFLDVDYTMYLGLSLYRFYIALMLHVLFHQSFSLTKLPYVYVAWVFYRQAFLLTDLPKSPEFGET